MDRQTAVGDARIAERMRAILDARLAYARDNLFHGYVDGHEVHHEPRSITR